MFLFPLNPGKRATFAWSSLENIIVCAHWGLKFPSKVISYRRKTVQHRALRYAHSTSNPWSLEHASPDRQWQATGFSITFLVASLLLTRVQI